MESQMNLRARRSVPSSTLPEDRLQVPLAACAACGADVDPLRTSSLLAFEDGIRVLCNDSCRDDYRAGSRARRKPQLSATPASTVKRTPQLTATSASPTVQRAKKPRAVMQAPRDARWLYAGTLAVLLGAALACFGQADVALASALCSVFAAGIALRASVGTLADIGVFAWLCGPLGVVGAALAGWLSRDHDEAGLAALSAAFGALVLLARALCDQRAHQPIERAAEQLRTHLVPDGASQAPAAIGGESAHAGELADEPLEAPLGAPAEADKARIGDELVVRRGERAAVDGVVQLGEARVLPFPSATDRIVRRPGDPLLAGARVVEGALRVLVTGVGEDRSLARALRAGDVDARQGARLLRLARELSRYGGLFTLLLALGILVFGDKGGPVMPLSAASALLIAAPWLAVRRAAEWPFAAAATAAAARGVVFSSGAVLEAAGQVGVVALTPHRTLTEGNPELIELHTLGNDSPTQLLGLIAAAELAASDHALSRSIAQHATARGIELPEVRRSISVPGHGVSALGPTGEEVIVGSRRLLLDNGVSVAVAEAYAARAEAHGRTVVFVSVGGRVRAVLALYDQLRAGARSAVQRMFDMGLEVVLFTGGQRQTAEQLATRLDIAHVKAELLAEERGQEVRSLREAGSRVAVIGYPSDDGPALAAADVAIALGAAGGPATERTIGLVGDDVRDAAAALWIARAARKGVITAERLALAGFATLATAALAGLLEPAVAGVAALAIDFYGIHAGARLLHRIALRLPSGS